MEPVRSSSSFTANYSSEESKLHIGKKKMFWYIVLGLVAVVLYIYISNPLVITVTGTGEVSVPATNATISFTLSSSDNSSQNAVASVTSKADTVRTYLTAQGITEGDIAQSQVTVIPSNLITTGATGYQATITMAAKTTHVSTVANLVPNLYANGALVVSQPVLSVENQDNLDQQAFDAAMADAKTQASRIGLKSLKLIRKIVSVSQVSSPTTSTSTTRADSLTSSNDPTAAANGVFKIVKVVSVSFKMW